MSPSLDYAASILLCPEDSASVLDLEEEESDEISGVIGLSLRHGDDSPGGLCIELPLQSDDCIQVLLKREEEHLPMEGYAERLMQQPGGSDLLPIRRHAIDWIWKVCKHYKFGPLTAVLSANYLDRFLSVYCLLEDKTWITQLVAVACLSLAAKMEETVVPHLLDLQVGEVKHVFETKTVHRMELLVLNTLGWRIQAVTACSFIDYYLHKFNDGDAVSKVIVSRSINVILSTSKVAEFLVFRPSEIAASVALMALGKHENTELQNESSYCKHLRKDRVLKCYKVLQDNNFIGKITPRSVVSSVFTMPHSLIGVLDTTACESQESEGPEGTSAETPTISVESSPARKGRKNGI